MTQAQADGVDSSAETSALLDDTGTKAGGDLDDGKICTSKDTMEWYRDKETWCKLEKEKAPDEREHWSYDECEDENAPEYFRKTFCKKAKRECKSMCDIYHDGTPQFTCDGEVFKCREPKLNRYGLCKMD